MSMTPRQRRAERRSRHSNAVDMNLVSLIDVFTILIFFLLSNTGGIELLPSPKDVKLPESVAQTPPRDTIIVVVNATDILVGNVKVASVADVIDSPDELIAPLQAELERQQAASPAAAPPAMGASGAAAEPRRLTIMGDKEIPYRLLRKVMATSARANYSDVSFAVRQRFES
jgi:biopolymer transport protein ExbD